MWWISLRVTGSIEAEVFLTGEGRQADNGMAGVCG
jgi:hypothetical protein